MAADTTTDTAHTNTKAALTEVKPKAKDLTAKEKATEKEKEDRMAKEKGAATEAKEKEREYLMAK